MNDIYHRRILKPDFTKVKSDDSKATEASENSYKGADGKYYSSLKAVKLADDNYFDRVSPK